MGRLDCGAVFPNNMSQSTARARLPVHLLLERMKCMKPILKTEKNAAKRPSTVGLRPESVFGSSSFNQTVFAEPLHLSAQWRAPVIDKSNEDKAFLLEVLNRSDILGTTCSDVDKKHMVDAMERFEANADQFFYSIGDEGDYFYILQSGTVSFYDHYDVMVCSVNAGSSFGEVALLYNSTRSTSCKTTSDCILWRLDQITCRKILATDQLNLDQKYKKLVRRIPLFMDLDDKCISGIIDSLRPENGEKGNCIIAEGEPLEKFYIILSGKVMIQTKSKDDVNYTSDKIISAGSYFGDRTIISQKPAAFKATLLEDSTFLTLTSSIFRDVHKALNKMTLASQDRRTLSSIPIFIEADILPHEVDILVSQIVEEKLNAGNSLLTYEDNHTDALFLVRKGEVIVNMPGNYRRVKAGEYFGESTLCYSAPSDKSTLPRLSLNSIFSAVVTEDAELGVLSKEKIESVIGKRLMESGEQDEIRKNETSPEITANQLKRLCLLGTGTFGKVYLAQTKGRKNKKVFALKVQKKQHIVQQKMVTNIMRERNLMEIVRHPFVTNLISATQDEENLYMILPFYQGGELLSIMNTAKKNNIRLNEAKVSFYGAVTLEGLEHLHQKNIVYRDFKPENVLIDINGYPVIIDLGFSKIVMDKTFTFCGTPVYLAPEVIVNKGYNKAADQWAWAVVLYEMLIGVTPFYKENIDAMELFKRIIRCNINYPVNTVSSEFKHLIKSILLPQPSKRLGNSPAGDQDIKRHKWFRRTDFSALRTKSVQAPWIPPCRSLIDSSCFKPIENKKSANGGEGRHTPISSSDQLLFQDYGPYCLSQ